MNNYFLCICRPDTCNTIITHEYDLKSISEIRVLNSLTDSELIAIHTPLYQIPLKEQDHPIELYPNLIQNSRPDKFFRPDYYLVIIPNTPDSLTLYINVDCQNNLHYPHFPVSFYEADFKTFQDISKYILSKFPFEYSKEEFTIEDRKIKSRLKSDVFFVKALKNPITFHCTISDASIKKIEHRVHILNEIIITERSYIDDLKTIMNYWIPNLEKMGILTKSDFDSMFGDIPDIITCHSQFYTSLQMMEINFSTIVSHVFLNFSNFCLVSKNYISTYVRSMQIINEKILNNQQSASTLQKLAEKNTCEGRDLFSYMIAPIQRMPQYFLFFNDLLEYTPESHPDYTLLKVATTRIQKVTQEIDSATKKATNARKLIEIQLKMSNIESILEPTRRYITEAYLMLKKPVSAAAKIYLFNDIILINTIEQKTETLLFKKHINKFFYFQSYDEIYFSYPIIGTKNLINHSLTHFAGKFESLEASQMFLTCLEECRKYPKNKSNRFVWRNSYLKTQIKPSISSQGCLFEGSPLFFGGSYKENPVDNFFMINMKSLQAIPFKDKSIPPRFGHSCSVLDGFLYIFGGKGKDEDFYNDLWKFKRTKCEQIIIPKKFKDIMPEKRAYHTADPFEDTQLIIFGGLSLKKKVLNDFWIFDSNEKKWTIFNFPDAPSPRYAHSSGIVGNKLIIYGGKNTKEIFGDCYIFDLKIWMWSKINLTEGELCLRYGHRSFVCDSFIVFLGGTPDNKHGADPVALNVETKHAINFKSCGNVPPSLTLFGLNLFNNSTLVIYGGCEAGTKFAQNEIYFVDIPSRLRDTIESQAEINEKLLKNESEDEIEIDSEDDDSIDLDKLLDDENKNEEKNDDLDDQIDNESKLHEGKKVDDYENEEEDEKLRKEEKERIQKKEESHIDGEMSKKTEEMIQRIKNEELKRLKTEEENNQLKEEIKLFKLKQEEMCKKTEEMIQCIKDAELKCLKAEEENKQLKEVIEKLQNENQSKITTHKGDDNIFIDESIEKEFYLLEGQIGEGATSITYKIIDKRTNIPMCKKVLKYREGLSVFKDAKRTMCEFEVMHNVTHPCICKAHYINMSEVLEIRNKKGENEEITTISLFLDYLEHSLNEVLKMKISNTLKTRIIIDISHAMNFLHQKGMMHRDLKIENIMLNSFFETKLVDFGLVRINETYFDGFSFVEDSMTRGIGTLAYMSPEMANEEDYDNKTDVYSFGILLHVIFTGILPKQSLKDKLNGKQINLPEPSRSISRFCIDLISKCLSYKPSDRPSFEQILQLMRDNSYALSDDVDPSILEKRDNELNIIENNT